MKIIVSLKDVVTCRILLQGGVGPDGKQVGVRMETTPTRGGEVVVRLFRRPEDVFPYSRTIRSGQEVPTLEELVYRYLGSSPYPCPLPDLGIMHVRQRDIHAWLNRHLETSPDDDGWIAYKTFGEHYRSPEHWKIEEGSEIVERVDTCKGKACSYGINVAPPLWIAGNLGFSKKIWRLLIPKKQNRIVVPFLTDGKFRCSRAILLHPIGSMLDLHKMIAPQMKEVYKWLVG
jgi:hypothetical protein